MVGSNPFESTETGDNQAGFIRRGWATDARLVVQIPHDLDWQRRAACRDSDLDFTADLRGQGLGIFEELQAVCASCPVQEECAGLLVEVALDVGITGRSVIPGVWAGRRATDLWSNVIAPRKRALRAQMS